MKGLPEKPPSDWSQVPALKIDKMSENVDLQKEVREYNRRYLYWDELKYRIPDPDRRQLVWSLMKILRILCYEHVPYPPLELTYSFTPEIAKNLHTFDRHLSDTIRIHNKTIRLEQSYIINSLMEEAIASSILEGAATTRKKAKEMLMAGRKPKNNGEQMVINNYEAMRFILEKKDESISPQLICDIHRIVTRATIEEEDVGRFRTNNDIVVADPATGTILHTPPDYQELQKLISEFCRFANEDGSNTGSPTEVFIHPIIKGIILHYLIGYIHPFADGNGRTARSIFYWYVLSRGYWLFEYMAISRIILRSKTKYALAYLHTEYDAMDLTYFINYNISCINEALIDLLRYLEAKQSEQNATKAIIRKIKGINQRQADILRLMMEHSDEYFTIRQIMQMHAVVYQTARNDLLHLAEMRHIRQEKRGREFVFIFNENSDLWREKDTMK